MIKTKDEFDQFIIKNWNEINKYIDQELTQINPPFYNSVDIRESKNKYAPVDNNIYPAGFNNICLLDLDETAYQIKNFHESKKLRTDNWAILIESHTKNTFYLDNIFYLKKAIKESGVKNIFFISLENDLFSEENKLLLESFSKFDIEIHLAEIKDHQFFVKNIKIDNVILNNDQSKQIEINWNKILTPVFPSPELGWYQRQKITHFEKYFEVAEKFCGHFNMDPDLICAKFKALHDIDFSTKESFDKLEKEVDDLKSQLSPNQKIFLKASKGTYGMGIQVVNDGSDVNKMNRKVRNKMDIGKNKIKFTDILIQEGIDTIIQYDNMPAEVTIYLINGKSVGGFMRANSEKDHQSNLNSKGMVFKKFCISEIRQNQDYLIKEAVYSVIARLSTIAAGLELKK